MNHGVHIALDQTCTANRTLQIDVRLSLLQPMRKHQRYLRFECCIWSFAVGKFQRQPFWPGYPSEPPFFPREPIILSIVCTITAAYGAPLAAAFGGFSLKPWQKSWTTMAFDHCQPLRKRWAQAMGPKPKLDAVM